MAPSSKEGELEKLQRADHDVLIGLKVTLDSYIIEARQSRADENARYADHEARIRGLETVIEVNKGTQATTASNRRVLIEVFGLVISGILILVTWYTGHH